MSRRPGIASPAGLDERDVLATVNDLALRTGILQGEPARAPDAVRDPSGALPVLSDIVQAALTTLQAGSGGASHAAELMRVAEHALELEDAVRDLLTERRARRHHDVQRAIARLRAHQNRTALLDHVCDEAARGTGLHRVMLSDVRDGVVTPLAITGASNPETGWLGRTSVSIANVRPEAACVETGRPVIVANAAREGSAHDPLRRLTDAATSFVIAPVAPAGQVIGILHGDRARDARGVDEDDRDTLWSFAQAFGLLYERAALIEHLAAQGDAMPVASAVPPEREVLETVRLDRESSADVAEPPAPDPEPHVDVGLTVREREVLGLMAKGCSNREVASRLGITQHTAKAHVRHMLRKAGAANRTELVSRYINEGAGP